jgi:hypothetical protein
VQNHLVRLAICSAISLVVAGVAFRSHRSFAIMTAGWAVINLIICLSTFRNTPPPMPQLREFMMLNMGLNAAYIGVGLALLIPKVSTQVMKENGSAVAIQGIILMVLDGYLLTQLKG